MPKLIDLTGNRFGRLTVIKPVGRDNFRNTYWLCKCDCGNFKTTLGSQLRKGACRSCGCLQRERTAEAKTIHGGKYTRLYHIYCGMKARCYNKNSPSFYRYGGRSIKICDEWRKSFAIFREWALSNGYDDNLSIDRIDNDGDYCPENCRWITMTEQQMNKSDNHVIEYGGKRQALQKWADEIGINHSSLIERINKYGCEMALSMPKGGSQWQRFQK